MFRLLLLLVLAYFVFRVARNLWQAVMHEGTPTPGRVDGAQRREEAPARHVWDREVEEARYRDL